MRNALRWGRISFLIALAIIAITASERQATEAWDITSVGATPRKPTQVRTQQRAGKAVRTPMPWAGIVLLTVVQSDT